MPYANVAKEFDRELWTPQKVEPRITDKEKLFQRSRLWELIKEDYLPIS